MNYLINIQFPLELCVLDSLASTLIFDQSFDRFQWYEHEMVL